MARAGEVIENPVSGERIRWLVTAADSYGALLRWEHTLSPGAAVVRDHVHPRQQERFEVLAGQGRFRAGSETREAAAGDIVVVPPGIRHGFRNTGNDELRVLIEVRPSLRMENLFEAIFALARAGRATRTGQPRLFEAALIAQECSDVAYLPGPPVTVQKAGIAALAGVARRLGYRMPETA